MEREQRHGERKEIHPQVQQVGRLEDHALQQQAKPEAEQRGHEAEREVDRHRADEVQLRRARGQVEALHEDGEEQRREQRAQDELRFAQELRRLGGDERDGGEVGGGDLGAGKDAGFDVHGDSPRVHGTTMRATRAGGGRPGRHGRPTHGRGETADVPRARQCLRRLHDESAGASGARGQPAENQSDRTHTPGLTSTWNPHGAFAGARPYSIGPVFWLAVFLLRRPSRAQGSVA